MNVLSIDQVNERRVDCFYHSFVMALRNRPLFDVVQHERVQLGDFCSVANVRETSGDSILHIYFGHEDRPDPAESIHPMREGVINHIKVCHSCRNRPQPRVLPLVIAL
jgi:hypothetical protein